jgi:hypothetical protein
MLYSRNFPVGEQFFEKLRLNDAIYVDKTQFILRLVQKKFHPYYFLSRPRRFGKSLFLDTLEQFFRGKKELFRDLYIYDKVEWAAYPVIRLSMDRLSFIERGLEQALYDCLKGIASKEDIVLTKESYSTQFGELIEKLSEKYQKGVVVLIDEYDKPIINYIDGTSSTQAEANRTILKAFYGVLKPSGNYLRFLFITGVSKFSKVSIFSDLNNLSDLTLDERYATVCGFTEAELRHYCQAGLDDLAAKEKVSVEAIIAKIRHWYDGFSWNGIDFVYNPYSTMRLMDSLQFKNYWFESASPTFLVNLIHQKGGYDFTNLKVGVAFNLRKKGISDHVIKPYDPNAPKT